MSGWGGWAVVAQKYKWQPPACRDGSCSHPAGKCYFYLSTRCYQGLCTHATQGLFCATTFPKEDQPK